MQPHKRRTFLVLLKLEDIFLMLTALALSFWLESLSQGQSASVWELLQLRLKVVNFILVLLFGLLWHLVFLSLGLYNARRLEHGQGEWKDLVKATLIGGMFLLAVTVAFQRTNVGRNTILMFTGLACLLTYAGRAGTRAVLSWLLRHDRSLCSLLLIGSNQRAYNMISRILAKPHLGYRVVGYLDTPPNGQSYDKLYAHLRYLGSVEDFNTVLDREEIDEVVITLPIRSCYERIKGLIDACEAQGIRAHLLSDFFPLKLARVQAGEFDDGLPTLTLVTGAMTVWPAAFKRAFDLIVGVPLVLLLSPVFLLIALLIKLTSPDGPVLFVQTRVGYNRRRFKLLKFRTMVPDAERLQASLEALNEAQGPVFKIKNDPRITPIGRILRKTSLDELPQLFNVIKGDMSLVGPRPLPLRDVERFEELWLRRRFSVRPGITCLWQVNGRSDTAFDEWIEQDLEYIDHWSLALDFKILVKTIPVVLRGTGAH
jgi:exopolysaccharide biosynthesis polyprenyl glycosylphosphotransferase